jgi:hypothetical protein
MTVAQRGNPVEAPVEDALSQVFPQPGEYESIFLRYWEGVVIP